MEPGEGGENPESEPVDPEFTEDDPDFEEEEFVEPGFTEDGGSPVNPTGSPLPVPNNVNDENRHNPALGGAPTDYVNADDL